jgi:hypothetical protein
MAPPESKLVIDFTVSVVAPHKQLRLFKVGEGPEGKVRGPSIAVGRERILQVSGIPQEIRKFLRWYYLGCEFCMGVVNDERLPKLKRPICWISGSSLGRDSWFVWFSSVWHKSNH